MNFANLLLGKLLISLVGISVIYNGFQILSLTLPPVRVSQCDVFEQIYERDSNLRGYNQSTMGHLLIVTIELDPTREGKIKIYALFKFESLNIYQLNRKLPALRGHIRLH